VSWRGVRCQKCPFDLWQYQQLISALCPNLIIELGTAAGGTTLFLSDVLSRSSPSGRIVSVDIDETCVRPVAKRITYLSGRSSVDPAVVEDVTRLASELSPVMVIADSDHHSDHVLAELRSYSPLVTAGSYFIVEDTNINGHPVFPEFGSGPAEAVEAFLKESPHFIRDTSPERYLLTFNPGGYLRRLK
jgi:cephalosporin hydroxylase